MNLFSLGTVNQRPADPAPFKEWLAKGLNEGRGWDVLVRETLTATGPLADAPQGLFFYYNADMNGQFTPKILAGNIGQVFLGVQLQCAECHNHPFSAWKQTDFWSMASFFAQTARMETVENKNTPGVKERHLEQPKPGKKRPTPPKEISINIPNDGEARHGGKKVPAAFLDGKTLQADPTKNHRVPFAEWLTARDNRLFARAAVNRFWAHFFGRGFVNPLNDFGDHNAPSHPALLDELADEFVASGFDVRHLIRCICLSGAYQRTSRVAPGNEKPEAEALFARMASRVLTPEQLYDTLCVSLEVPEIAPNSVHERARILMHTGYNPNGTVQYPSIGNVAACELGLPDFALPNFVSIYAGFADRIVIYKKTGEVLKRISLNDILRPTEWVYVNWVQGNLYWLSEYPDVMKGGEPPRCGYRYYRVSPDYSVLEFTVGPNSDAVHKVKDLGPDVVSYRRPVWVSLTDGAFLDKKPTEKDRIPVRPFVGDLIKRGDAMKNYVPSLDPVRVAGKVGAENK